MTRIKFAITSLVLAMGSSSSVNAGDWGCKVLLCLANPGSPTEYAECVPPITKLYKQLARGGGFPTCSGADFSTSHEGVEPFECPDNFELVRVQDPDSRRLSATCQSKAVKKVPAQMCLHIKGQPPKGKWFELNGERFCGLREVRKPVKREKPHYIDVTIEGGGTHRVWY
ncbi:hypothetical protein [Brucella pseudogrignonensis]|uniref:hypothetical protein n=1 Tax=Brucella pseudogrignonensis TaxID=419475 RepID=UPI0038D01A05